jgi:hypothetical protein
MQCRFFLDVVITERPAILQLLARKHKALLVTGGMFCLYQICRLMLSTVPDESTSIVMVLPVRPLTKICMSPVVGATGPPIWLVIGAAVGMSWAAAIRPTVASTVAGSEGLTRRGSSGRPQPVFASSAASEPCLVPQSASCP